MTKKIPRGVAGGQARAASLPPSRRSEIARQGGLASGKNMTPQARKERGQNAAKARHAKSGKPSPATKE